MSKSNVVSYFFGLSDAGVSLGHDKYEVPLFLRDEVRALMTEAADAAGTVENADDFASLGRWGCAARAVMFDLDKHARGMTSMQEYPKGLSVSDRMFSALLNAMRGD